MSTFAFQASCVVSEAPGKDCHLAGFADREYGGKYYLMLQRSFEDDEQDVRLGMNTYYVEWCSQEKSGYGGIYRFILKAAVAEITFEGPMVEALGGVNCLSISFELPAAKRVALIDTLRLIFAGSSCLEVADA